eukprot:TRINITY_DN2674_c0_g1_i1.p1 TRINITY_DN2674_c0_g1~~TRINITY_DN2674_c0_g1_i1.p1  ORF type:complete len:594 (+),score=133.82 TRINITY_DN2674_c0_g1_i1:64-1845(+)
MPTVNVRRDALFAAIGQTFTNDEFDELCFQFGIELDEITTEDVMLRRERGDLKAQVGENDADIIYKIDVSANRYDLLCLEGLARALRIYLGKEAPPRYEAVPQHPETEITMTVLPETSVVRPYVVCAILRDMHFDSASYNSFIELQDKLHNNICRKRTVVAIGTHDLDTLKGPFTYEALPPKDIRFKPLNQEREFAADELMVFYESDLKLRKYLDIIRSSPVYPVIYDANRTVLSLPPIINSDHSKITLNTKNVFIECTATDLTKAKITLNVIITMFSQYCAKPFTAESVKVTYQSSGETQVWPDLSTREVEIEVAKVNKAIGINIKADDVVSLLSRMQFVSEKKDENAVSVIVPASRSDVLHTCDVIEDVAVAYGFNNIEKTIPKTLTTGKQLPLNKLSDMLRHEFALAGYTEILNLVLCSFDDNYSNLRRSPDGLAVRLANPQTPEFQVVRTSLIPGILKTLSANKRTPLPIQIFEVGDVVVKDASKDVGAGNRRRMIAAFAGTSAGFENVHGLMDRIFTMLRISWSGASGAKGYHLTQSSDPTFFDGRCADIICNGNKVGVIGVVHPEVLDKFDVPFACSLFEMDVEPFL